MPNNTNLIWGLICALALVVGLIAGRTGLAGGSPKAPSASNFRADFPLKQIQAKTFKNEAVQIDGNAFIDCTFDNVTFRFDGEAPFRFTNDHFEPRSKVEVTSNNPVVKSIIELMSAVLKLEGPVQNQTKSN